MRKTIAALTLVSLVAFVGCKDKPAETAQKPVKTEVVQKPVVKDTIKEEPKPVVEEVVPPKPDDKYFLIAGSFENRANADLFKDELEKQGYNSQVIERPGGPNGEFYKVSCMSFYDRSEAFSELDKLRNVEGQDVWLLIK